MKGEYKDYLRSREWADVSNIRREMDGNKCVCCGVTENLNVHHIIYPADWNDTTPQMLVTLCHDCHILVHRMQEQYDNEYSHGRVVLTKNGFVSQECVGYKNFTNNSLRWVVVELWKKNLFSLQDVKAYINKVVDVFNNSKRGKIGSFVKESMDMLSVVKDCYIANKEPTFDEERRKERREKKTKYH